MTSSSLPQETFVNQPVFHYSVQTDAQRKKGGGLGRSEQSYWKHDEIEKLMKRQLPVLNKIGGGCIIDMHSGDGKDTPHPQPDFFSGGSLKTTPTMAIQYARKYNSDVILCERSKDLRSGLVNEYGNDATVIANNRNLVVGLRERIALYKWILVLNDPNGYGDQSVDVMNDLSCLVPISDFIVVFNVHSLCRPMGLARNKDNENHPRSAVRASFRSGIENQWMLDDEEWGKRLGKRRVLSAGPRRISEEMTAKILLISNFIPGVK